MVGEQCDYCSKRWNKKKKSINKKFRTKTKRPQIFISYDLMEGLIDEEENIIFETKLELFSIGTIIILDEII